MLGISPGVWPWAGHGPQAGIAAQHMPGMSHTHTLRLQPTPHPPPHAGIWRGHTGTHTQGHTHKETHTRSPPALRMRLLHYLTCHFCNKIL